MKTRAFLFLLFIGFFVSVNALAQDLNEQRFEQMEKQMKSLAGANPGLNEKVDFSVSGATIQEFLRGIAEANELNISVEPSLNFRIYNNFTNEKVMNILLFLAREHNMDIRFIGSIMSFHPYTPVPEPKPEIREKEIRLKYNGYGNLLTLDLTRDTLSKVVRKITQDTKKNVIFASGLADRQISVYIQDAPFDDAIEKMAYANNLKVRKTTDGFYVIVSLEEGEELAFEESQSKSPFNNPFAGLDKNRGKKPAGAPSANNNAGGEILVDVQADSLGGAILSVEVVNAPITETIKTVAAAAGISYFLFSEVKGNTTLRVLNTRFDEFLKKLLQGTDFTFKKNNNLYLIGDRKLEGLRSNKVLQLKYRRVKDIMEMIPAEIKKGVEVKEFVELNSILLSGAHPQIEEIEAFVAALDRVVPMVLIDVIIMDIRKSRSVETGLKAGLSDSVRTNANLYPGIDFNFSSRSVNSFLSWLGTNNTVNLGRVKPDFYVSLKALEDNSNVEVRSTPKLSTLNGHKATLSIGSTRYYSITTQNVIGTLTPQTVMTRQFQQVEANLGITILPMVSGDDQVTLEIDVNNSDFLDTPDDAPPPKATSQFNSLIRVRNEEMIVLGGLERYQKSESGTGFPILSRIPILKWIFSSRSKSKSKTVTVVFIKPSIIH